MKEKVQRSRNEYYLEITSSQSISGLQKEFSTHFPYLKIEFFREPCIKGKAYKKDKMIKGDELISRLRLKKGNGKIHFNKKIKVGVFEAMFFDEFGICVQVFRKSGNVWLETSSTDDWTLEQQNEEGISLARHLKMEKENPEDHDIY